VREIPYPITLNPLFITEISLSLTVLSNYTSKAKEDSSEVKQKRKL
jgi:hypothetical protein